MGNDSTRYFNISAATCMDAKKCFLKERDRIISDGETRNIQRLSERLDIAP